jgi:sugar phosphate isomerase/epimerase
MRSNGRPALTRRAVLAAGLSAAGAVALGRRAGAAFAPPDETASGGPYGPFKMGLQSYSLRGIGPGGKPDLGAALAATRELGLHYWESFPVMLPATTERPAIAEYKKKLDDAGVTLLGYGVVRFGRDRDADRKVFEFARLMGLDYLSADPDPKSFDALDKLVEEYGVNLGIHNHGPGHQWAQIDAIAAAIKDHSPRIGCCVDTGHFLRSREDPVRAVEVFGPRVYGVHLKDVKDAKTFTVLGEGDLRTVDLLKALARLNYRSGLNLEYEENPKNPMAEIRACLKATREAVAAMKQA